MFVSIRYQLIINGSLPFTALFGGQSIIFVFPTLLTIPRLGSLPIDFPLVTAFNGVKDKQKFNTEGKKLDLASISS